MNEGTAEHSSTILPVETRESVRECEKSVRECEGVSESDRSERLRASRVCSLSLEIL